MFLLGARVHEKSKQGTNSCTPEFLILSVLKLTSCGLVVFIDMNTYVLSEAGISKHS